MSEIIGKIKAINLGLEGFGDGLRGQGVSVDQIKWKPPINVGLLKKLDRLDPAIVEKIEAANKQAIANMLAAEPHWIGIKRAIDVVPGMKPNMILHSGPPNDWDHLISTQKKGVVGGALHAGLAKTKEEAIAMIKAGEIELGSCNDHFCVGAGAGIVTANMVVNVSKDLRTGLEGYCIPFEGRVGLGVWGVYNEEVERNLREIEDEFGPAVTMALEKFGPIDVRSIIARSMQMGDEIHTRQTAAGLILVSEIVPKLLDTGLPNKLINKCIAQFTATERWFHPLGMSGGMSIARSIKGIPYCTLVTSIAQNGVKTGIKVSHFGERWFTAPAPRFVGSYFSSEWGPEDAVPYMGDSTVTEVVGMGAFAAAAAPVVMRLRDGGYREAIAQSREMQQITYGINSNYPIPLLDFTGPGMGIDVRKVIETGITPICHGGIISKDGGQIGAGAARFPSDHYMAALEALIDDFSK